MLGNILDLIHEETSQGKKGVLCTLVDATGSSPRHLGARMWVRPDGSTAGTIGGGTVEFRVQERAKTMLLQHENPVLHRESMWNDEVSEGEPACGGEVGIFLEILGQDRELVLFGAGHVGLAVARLGHFAGFAVTVWDERPEFASSERFPEARVLACPLDRVFEEGLRLSEGSFVVIATRGHALDAAVAKALDGMPAAYIGMIGSRRKIATVRDALLRDGVSQEHLNRLFQPVGLPIGAETPEEIAISVLSEIVAVASGADIRSLREPLRRGGTVVSPRFEEDSPASTQP